MASILANSGSKFAIAAARIIFARCAMESVSLTRRSRYCSSSAIASVSSSGGAGGMASVFLVFYELFLKNLINRL